MPQIACSNTDARINQAPQPWSDNKLSHVLELVTDSEHSTYCRAR